MLCDREWSACAPTVGEWGDLFLELIMSSPPFLVQLSAKKKKKREGLGGPPGSPRGGRGEGVARAPRLLCEDRQDSLGRAALVKSFPILRVSEALRRKEVLSRFRTGRLWHQGNMLGFG